ncbi:MAG: class I SAM-dependent methyltransferase [Pyrinomonadaceae bacterium]
MNRVRNIWEEYGKNDPYFAVMTVDENRKGNLGEAERAAFFQSGHAHVAMIWDAVETGFGIKLRPERSLDFGCGVGRIAIPLASRSKKVTAVDIADNMLHEAQQNCESHGVDNIEFLQTDRYLASEGSFDLVHSFITLQHIDPQFGIQIVRKMIRSLTEGGVGALHFTYKGTGDGFTRLRSRLYRDVPFLYRIRGAFSRGEQKPFIPVYLYDLNLIMAELQANGCHRISVKFSDHSILGVLILFRKEAIPTI